MRGLQLLFALLLSATTYAVYFDMDAFAQGSGVSKCVSQWVSQDQPVKVKVNVKPNSNDQTVNVNIFDDSPNNNKYTQQFGVTEQTFTFYTQAHANVIICFDNILQNGIQRVAQRAEIKIDMDSGLSVIENKSDQIQAELNPIESELRRLETNLEEIQEFLNHLKSKESHLRDLNELTNSRVSTFSIFTMLVLVTIATSQVFYLRKFFKTKKLI
ncbi:hypothetical protein BB561_001570 [Smittium simulii]|uniref:GOLD domain-containing protein n=1 Tax=Smittium simulii TaxID=133385 RepID=A0A2T9YU22_9FUNG|nr:hypothetical protein BB561_001570 [Smittium simulii]